MALPAVNLTAVLVAAVVAFVVGMVYYSPGLFGNKWLKLSGITAAQMKKNRKKGMGVSMFWGFVSVLVYAYILGAFMSYAGATSPGAGATIGFWAWLGFIGTTTLGSVLWEKKSFNLWILNNGHNLIVALVLGAVLGYWA